MEEKTKVCKKCGCCKPEREFKKMAVCISCENSTRNKSKKKTQKNIQRSKETTLKSRYGISTFEYNEMLLQQEGRCKICGKTSDKTLHIDHNHSTGKVRALLCNNCNILIGHAKEDPLILQQAMNYLMIYNG